MNIDVSYATYIRNVLGKRGAFTMGEVKALTSEQIQSLRSGLSETSNVYLQLYLDAAQHLNDAKPLSGSVVQALIRDRSVAKDSTDIDLITAFVISMDCKVVDIKTFQSVSAEEDEKSDNDEDCFQLDYVKSTDDEFVEIVTQKIRQVSRSGKVEGYEGLNWDVTNKVLYLVYYENGDAVADDHIALLRKHIR